MGYASLQAEHQVEVQRLQHFVEPAGHKVVLERWNKNSQVRLAFQGEQGFGLELSEYALNATQMKLRLTRFSDQVTQSKVFQREVLPFDKGSPPQISGVALNDEGALFLWTFFDKPNQAWHLSWESITKNN